MWDDNSNLVSKCLEFCQMLANKSKDFNFSLTMDSVSFSLDTRVVDTKMTDPVSLTRRKKSSPSTRRRNAKRRTLFLESKKQTETKESEKQTENKEHEKQNENKEPADATGSLKFFTFSLFLWLKKQCSPLKIPSLSGGTGFFSPVQGYWVSHLGVHHPGVQGEGARVHG